MDYSKHISKASQARNPSASKIITLCIKKERRLVNQILHSLVRALMVFANDKSVVS